MRTSFVLLSALLFGASSAALSTFYITATAKFELTNGYYSGMMYYKYDGSGANQHYLRFEFTSPATMNELIDYAEGVRYKVCSSTCEAGYYPYPAPVLAKQSSDTYSGQSEGSCKRYTPADASGLTAIWYNDAGTICRVELPDGRTFSLSGISKDPIDADKFKPGSACPAPVCKRVMDLVFVIDNSGSVTSYNWDHKIKPFMLELVNSFDIGADATKIGLVTYGSTARTVFDLSADKSYITKTINSASFTGGNTCTGCGINYGIDVLKNTGTHRTNLDPEKIMIVVTDGQNQWAQGTICADYNATCTKPGTTCKKRKCSGTWKTTTTSVCEEYGPSTTCKRHKCTACNGGWGKTCATKRCTKNSTTCTKVDPSYCTATWPSGCTIKNGKITTTYSGNAKCLCAGYKCLDYECAAFTCDEYACDSCTQTSNVCVEYEKKCIKYATTQTCSGTESCAEYECLEGKAECNKTVQATYYWSYYYSYDSYTAMLNGAITRTRTEWALYPATKRLPIVIAIGVGNVIEAELRAIASTLESKNLMYLVDNFAALSTLFDDLIEETCIKQTSNLESCDIGCKGFCGCNKQCYCPTCDTNKECTTYTCTVANSKTTNGCVAKHKDCTVPNKCKIPSASNKTEGCCSYTDRTCAPSADLCKIAYCDENTGCTTKPRVCVSDDPCKNVTGCDPSSGCLYGEACADLGPCKPMTCTAFGSSFSCSYTDKCTSDDKCMIPKCDERTGACSLDPVKCTPSNPCMTAKCYNGACYEEENMALKLECANKANSSCEEGFCNTVTGECDTKVISGENSNCGNCDLNTTVNCSAKNNKCYTYTCKGLPSNDTSGDHPVECIETPTQSTKNKCLNMTCDEELGWTNTTYNCPAPIDKCHFVSCVYNATTDTAECVETTNLDQTVDGICKIAYCDKNGLPAVKSTCDEYKPCKIFDRCEVVDGKADCIYKPMVCNEEENKCTVGFCNESTGECVYLSNATNCKLGNPCKTYDCFNSSGCKEYDITCDDNNNCTNDKCVPLSSYNASEYEGVEGFEPVFHNGTGVEDSYVCVHTFRCTSDNYCSVPVCNADGQCSLVPYGCEKENENSTLDRCRYYQCNEKSQSCKIILLPSAFLSVCGECVQTYAGDSSYDGEVEATKCIAGMSMPNFAATIGGAAVAGIVIAAIIVAAVIGISSALGTKELIKRAKKNADAGTNNNPLYEASDNEAINPAFTGEN